MFQYPYQRILELKTKDKEQSQTHLAKALQKQEKLEQQIASIEQSIDQLCQSIEGLQSKKIRVTEIINLHDYRYKLEKRLNQEKKEMHYATLQVNKRQQELAEKVKEEKVWDKHKSNALEHYITEERRLENLRLDEIAGQIMERQQGQRGE